MWQYIRYGFLRPSCRRLLNPSNTGRLYILILVTRQRHVMDEQKIVRYCGARMIFLTISILTGWLVHLRNLSEARRMIHLHDIIIFMCHHTGDGRYVHMMMSSNGNISALLSFCEGNSPVTGQFTSQRPVTRSFGVFFDLRLNKRLSKPSRRRWFEMPVCPIWRHCNDITHICIWPIDMI